MTEVTRNTQKIIKDGRLDSMGYENKEFSVLNIWLDQAEEKQEGIPLSGLISKVKEVAGLIPILKKIQNRQIEQDIFFVRWEE